MKSFAALFAGRDDVAGRYELPAGVKPSQKGKLAGRAQTLREAITEADYKKHNDGKRRLGIVPIRPSDNTVTWFALDADIYKTPTLHKDIVAKINRLMLPLVVTKSKSGGAHLWCFFRDPVPAAKAVDLAKDFIKKLGLDPKTEIFPKQTTINVNDDGNWINLPYFGDTCHGVADDGERELTLKEFLSHANGRVATLEDAKITKANTDASTEDAPPCIEKMLEDGIEEGGRNSAMAQIAVYLLKSDEDNWEDRLVEINDTKCFPPLSHDEIKTINRSVRNKNYQYLCNQQPMCSLCDKPTCVTRKYGVGTGEATAGKGAVVLVDQLEKIDGDEPTYRVTMQGRTFELPSIEHLNNFKLFRTQVMKRLDLAIPTTTQKMWDLQVGELLKHVHTIQAPKDTVIGARVVREFNKWVGRCHATKSAEVIILGQVFYDKPKGKLFFGASDFLDICDRKFPKLQRNQIWKYLHDEGAEEARLQIAGAQLDVWCMPLKDESILGGRGRK